MISALSFDLSTLRSAYLAGDLDPARVVAEAQRHIAARGDDAVWIHRLSEAELRVHLDRLAGASPASLPLYGVPFAIKDNIDLAGAPTTAACPEFGYTPAVSAFAVQRLLDAGAIPLGKTNLDQFATGLVGVRSPYGTPRNPFNPAVIPGGSSSGSAVAVATGQVAFALGTDTAGSGRIPASLNHLVGLKPTRGWFSTRGVVPACRSLDCVSVFAHTVAEATAVAEVLGIYDDEDAFARPAPAAPAHPTDPAAPFRLGVPRPDQLEWFGDSANPPLYVAAIEALAQLGGVIVEFDFAPFAAAARLLYEGPWVAERWSAVRTFHHDHADALHPVTRRIIEGGADLRAVDAFESMYRLAELKRAADRTWRTIDAFVLPTAATVYTCEEVAAKPITLNSRLGTYTNFANLLDTAALAIPTAFRPDGVPFGVTLFGPAWSDARLATLGSALQSRLAPPPSPLRFVASG